MKFKINVFLYGVIAILVLLAGFAYFLTRGQPIDSIAVLPFVNSNAVSW